MAAAALIIGVFSSVFSIVHNGYLIAWDVEHGESRPAMHAPAQRQMIDMTPLATNKSLGGK